MMKHYEDVRVNVVLVHHNVVCMEHIGQQVDLVVDDNNR